MVYHHQFPIIILLLSSEISNVLSQETAKFNDLLVKRTWVVELSHQRNNGPFTMKQADEFAAENGFVNLGGVGDLNGYFVFEIATGAGSVFCGRGGSSSKRQRLVRRQQEGNYFPMNSVITMDGEDNYDESILYPYLAKDLISQDYWNGIHRSRLSRRCADSVEQDLDGQKNVQWYELQVPLKRALRSSRFIFNDSEFRNQWYLVRNKSIFEMENIPLILIFFKIEKQ